VRQHGLRGESGGRIGRGFLDDLEVVDVPTAARRLTAATLVLHGDDDQVVRWPTRTRSRGAARAEGVAVTPACDHPTPIGRTDVLDRAVDWIATRLPLGTSA
jgi:pimeloyl-ACP methyl ester carboxylesterase